ncbi:MULTISPECIES: hypothetical protein [unclassified Nostoc]|uniref:hypothetical protein n=1 Tax=unclassified Nostoc TaxID=2593658 RepID=UPI002AD3F92F|nr:MULTISPECIES: hypothetical protein [unclassified Nostoc]MDZ8123684.1 hypothetical protein [Nostoc sp. CmiVER01]MDZ8225679.1 hypothetical protein [Nostoc sp. ChiVER01]
MFPLWLKAGFWGGIAIISGIAALLGYALFSHFSQEIIAATTAIAAGDICEQVCGKLA